MATDIDKLISIFKVETEAGTHFPGQAKAPHALVETAGLRDSLQNLGYVVSVVDALAGDADVKTLAKWQPAPKVNGVRNEENTDRVMHTVRTQIMQQLAASRPFTIVVGGDCSITPAVLSALWGSQAEGIKTGLLYMDGDADLRLPSQTEAEGSSAILDSMTMTHLTGRAGGLDSMRAFTRPDGRPLVDRENVVLFGFDPLHPSNEHWVYLLEQGFRVFTRPTVQKDAIGCVREALHWLSERVDVIFVHFDVDVIDCGEFPLANCPHYAGIDADKAFAALEEALAHNRVQGVTVTEINPNNDQDGAMVKRVADSILKGIEKREN